MAQFEEATAAVEASKNEKKRGGGGGDVPADEDRRKKISLFEATNSLMEGQSAEAMGGIVREDWSRAPALVRTLPFLRPKLKTPELQAQRDRLLALARTPMDRSPLHERVLMSVFRTITKEDTLPPRFGPRWETVGFQGDDPATDLRGSGMLALLQMLHMGAKRPKLVAELYALSQGGTAFPLMTCSINFTQVAMQALRSGSLTKDANKAKTLYEPFHGMPAVPAPAPPPMRHSSTRLLTVDACTCGVWQLFTPRACCT